MTQKDEQVTNLEKQLKSQQEEYEEATRVKTELEEQLKSAQMKSIELQVCGSVMMDGEREIERVREK